MHQTNSTPRQDAEERLGHLLDRTMTIDVSGRGAVNVLYDAVRKATAAPLSMNAARILVDTLRAGDVAVLATGFPVRPWVSPAIGETDGPPGVAALARALSMGLAVIPVVTTPAAMAAQIRDSLVASGVLILSLEEARRAVSMPDRPTCAAVVVERPTGAPPDDDAETFFSLYEPKILAALEHPGANKAGIYNTSLGIDISEGVARGEHLFALARLRGIPTLSFIDNANEIGAGSLPEDALVRIARSEIMAASSRVDDLVVATTANWAAYGTVAALSVLLSRPDILVSRGRDAAAIAAVMRAGGVEGVSGSINPEDGVDAIPTEISGHIVDLLAEIARNHVVTQTRGSF